MSSRAVRRATADLRCLRTMATSGSLVKSAECADEIGSIENGDVFHWRVAVQPPEDSPYSSSNYTLLFCLPKDYPFLPPTVRVLTPIFNPLVTPEGAVCENLLSPEHWKPTTPVDEMVRSVVQAIFLDFNSYPPINDVVALQLKSLSPVDLKARIEAVRATRFTV